MLQDFPRAVDVTLYELLRERLSSQSIRLDFLGRGDKLKLKNRKRNEVRWIITKIQSPYQEIPFVEERELYDLMNNRWKDVQQLSFGSPG